MADEPMPLSDEAIDWMERAPRVARIDVRVLVDEIRRLKRENHLLHLSRGSAADDMGLD